MTPRTDPLFGLPVPLVFAHRGGAGEAPESTPEAFRHALTVGADVIEIDLQMTYEGELVVWHGPKLEGVVVHNSLLSTQSIHDACWSFLSQARVRHPSPRDRGNHNLEPITERRMLRLSEFFEVLRGLEVELRGGVLTPINIELKGIKRPAPGWGGKGQDGTPIWKTLFSLIRAELDSGRRFILASNSDIALGKIRSAARKHHILDRLEATNTGGFATIGWWLGASPGRRRMEGLAYEAPHWAVRKQLVTRHHKNGHGVYPFLTGFGGAGVEHSPVELREWVRVLLECNRVDGLMTDHPALVVEALVDLGYR